LKVFCTSFNILCNLFFSRKSNSILFPEVIAKTTPNLIKFVLNYANLSVQVDSAINLCSSQCVQTNRDRVLKRIQELEKSVAVLERSAITIATQTPINESHRNHLDMSRKTIRTTVNRKNVKLRKAQMLNHFLQKNWRKMDKKMMLDFIAQNQNM